ncbi:DUF5995 family protein [Streptomyces sp. NBC_00893]|uniref:DUF5995 family protein n=1 Tax=Streptomyces sp. NBC_00893 TaxID=2975862 RepID=UPI00224F9490|nr:DUF5995 family protein [Streptomyces sp. NBC_00893]MCX4849274.1 DUF5995 family protein [Streptomyces sp. NBC_00893]
MAQFEQTQGFPAGHGPVVTAVPGIDRVIGRMRALRCARPPVGGAEDGVAVFNRVYLTVTETVRRQIDGGAFPDRRAATTLDVRFAERYLAAVDAEAAGERTPDCWHPLFQYRHHPGVRPLQFALSGINAHIGHDLPLAVVDTCRTLGCAPPDLEDEFDRVGDLLLMLEERIREDLMPGPDLLELADPLTHLFGSWSMERAREAAWSTALVLWRLSEVPLLAEEFRRRLDAGAGLVGRFLLTPCR